MIIIISVLIIIIMISSSSSSSSMIPTRQLLGENGGLGAARRPGQPWVRRTPPPVCR